MAEVANDRIAAVRRFSRFYTRHIGALREGLLNTPFPLTEARVMYELGQRESATATELGLELGLDAGYLSRMLRGFHERGLIDRRPSASDARLSHISLTPAGRAAFAELDAASRRDIGAMLGALPEGEQERLVRAMGTIESVLGGSGAAPYELREAAPEDMEWVVRRHRELYAQEYGFGETFAQLVERSADGFVRDFDADRERGWIATSGGERVGCVFLTRGPEPGVAKLRLLLVDPAARGLGVGGRLVDECIRFARQAGYRAISLWTNEVLLAARRIYADRGFLVVNRENQDHLFGHPFTAEVWEKEL
jgi:DNA-binding MarR family transcriptional regulator/GNAT superfamily N-acetyltransferase